MDRFDHGPPPASPVSQGANDEPLYPYLTGAFWVEMLGRGDTAASGATSDSAGGAAPDVAPAAVSSFFPITSGHTPESPLTPTAASADDSSATASVTSSPESGLGGGAGSGGAPAAASDDQASSSATPLPAAGAPPANPTPDTPAPGVPVQPIPDLSDSTASHTASTPGGAGVPAETIGNVQGAGGGLVINVTFDSSVSGAPAGFTTAVNTAVAYLESIFSNPITINIHVGYGEVNGQALGSGALGESEANYVIESYSAVRSALIAEGAPGSATLPVSSPFSGTVDMSRAEAKALGLLGASASTDGWVGFTSTYALNYTNAAVSGQYYFIGIFEHEITEDMGRVSLLDEQPGDYAAMDLFRYTSNGVRDLATGGSGSTAYFSIDNGATNLGSWNNNPSNGDIGDWYPSGPAPGGNDSFNDYSNSGVLNIMSADDITLMNALGYTAAGPVLPVITAVVESPSTGALNAGKSVTITLDFNEAITVTGGPTLTLNDGGTATLASGSGTTALNFTYMVGAGDTNVAALKVSSVNLNGGTLLDASSNAASLSVSGLTQTGPAIDTVAPTIASVGESPATGALDAGKSVTITLNFSEAVTVSGTPTLTLNNGAVASFTSGSGSSALKFTYTVGAHDTGVAQLAVSTVNLAGGAIKDVAGNAATFSLSGLNQAGPAIDTVAPTIASVIESPASGVESAGKVVTLTLGFSETVSVTGTPTLTLNNGAKATYASGSGSANLSFTYTVGAADADVAALAATTVNLSSATIQDVAGNAANLSLTGLTQTGPQIDAVAPTVVSIVDSPASGVLNAGKTVSFTVNLSEKVTVTGAPSLTLNDGGVATYVSGSGSTALSFTYTVGAHDTNVASLTVTSVNQAGGTIKDSGGVALANGMPAQTGPAIDTVAPTITTVLESPATGALGAGKLVTLTLDFSEAVVVTGTPTLTLNDGGLATYVSGSGGGALVFSYTTAASDTDTPSLAVSAVNLAGGSIQDNAGNAATLSVLGLTQTGPEIDTSPPAILSLVDSPASGVLNAGKVVTFTMALNEKVVVTGAPTLALNDGGVATLTGGSGSSVLTFSYTVGAHDTNEAALAVTGVNLAGGSIKDDGGNAFAGAIPAQAAPGIDTTIPTLTAVIDAPSVGPLNPGKSVTLILDFSEAVSVAGAPSLTLNDGGVATYQSGSGTGALVFTYTVAKTDTDVAALTVTGVALNGGAIADAGQNAAALALSGLTQTGPQIVTSMPTVSGVMESPATGLLGLGKTVSLTVDFDKQVLVTGAPTLSLSDGGTATYVGGSGSNALTFSYVVGAGEPSVAALTINALNLAGGTIKDAAGNAAVLTLTGLTQAGPATDTVVPTITSLIDAPASGVLVAGNMVTLSLGFSEAVSVSGAPTLTLNDGGTATFQGGSGSNVLTFSYQVGAHDTSVAHLAATALNLGVGSITDAAGNFASLTLSGVAQSGPQVENVSDLLTAAFTNVLIASPTSALATTPTLVLPGGGQVTNPIFTDAQGLPGLISAVSGGAMTLATALNTIEHEGDASTSVATIAYEFFTGAIPSQGGYGFLVNGTSNPNDLDSPYYAQFNEQNRYINFASNLGKAGAGEAAFSASYGSLSLSDAMTKAYTAIFGFSPAPGKIAAILATPAGSVGTIADYFASYGQDGPNGLGTKAAAVGWLMTVAVQADLGVLAAANDDFLAALANGTAQFNIDLLSAYPTMTAAQAAAIQAQALLGAVITNPLQVADTAAHVLANLDALQGIMSTGKLASIALTDAGVPTLGLTAPQAGADSGGLAKITSPYALDVTGQAAQFSGQTIGHLTTANSALDVTDLNVASPIFSATFTENAAGTQGTLGFTDGSHSASVTLIGQLATPGFSGTAAAAGFTFASDGGAGTMIGWHG